MRVRSRAVGRSITIQHGLFVGVAAILGFVAGRRTCARSGVAPTWGRDVVSILMGLGMGAAIFVGFVLGLALIGLTVRSVERLVRRLARPPR